MHTFSKVIAPLIPFLAEEIYEVLDIKKFTSFDSVHFEIYPEAVDLTKEDHKVLEDMQNTRDVVSLGLAIRDTSNIKIRQALSTLSVKVKTENVKTASILKELIKEEVNVKKVSVNENITFKESIENENYIVYLDTHITKELAIEGKARDLVRKIQTKRKKLGLSTTDFVNVLLENTEENKNVLKEHKDYLLSAVNAKNLEISETFEVTKI
ncbi:DUF5915 domain-containing protein [Patescibacteria group bacterium]